MATEPRDIHKEIIDHDEKFHAYMDARLPAWRTLSFEAQRRFARAWLFGSLYGGSPGTVASPPRSRRRT